MRKVLSGVLIGLMLALALATPTFATPNPQGTGQPNQSCEEQPVRPGNASEAKGSAFNPDGVAGTHYAGEQTQNSKNPHSASQYDVACFQVSTNH